MATKSVDELKNENDRANVDRLELLATIDELRDEIGRLKDELKQMRRTDG